MLFALKHRIKIMVKISATIENLFGRLFFNWILILAINIRAEIHRVKVIKVPDMLSIALKFEVMV